MNLNYYKREQANEIPIYNPRDAWHNSYFKFKNWPYVNPECRLSEKDYERMCDLNGTNPIYPTVRKRVVPVEQRIAERRKELWINV